MNEQQKLYPERDPAEFVDYYMRHVEAMTSEELFGKGDIAAQLAWRDREIDELRQRLADEERLARHHSGMAEAYGIENDELRVKLALAEKNYVELLGVAAEFVSALGKYASLPPEMMAKIALIDAAIDAGGETDNVA